MDDILHGSGGATRPATRNDAPIMPGLVPARAERLKYKDDLIGWINVSGKGWLYRESIPADMRKYLETNVDTDYPIITDPDVSADRREKRMEDRRRAFRLNQTNRLILDQFVRDAKISLAADLYKAFEPKAKTLIDGWRREHLLDAGLDGVEPDLTMTDGGAVFRSIIAYLSAPARESDTRSHDLAIEAMQSKAGRLGNNTSPEQFAGRIEEFDVKHNRHLGDRKMTGKRLSQFYLSQLPENLYVLKMSMESLLDRTPGGWEDSIAVLDECISLVTRIYDPTKTPSPCPTCLWTGGGDTDARRSTQSEGEHPATGRWWGSPYAHRAAP